MQKVVEDHELRIRDLEGDKNDYKIVQVELTGQLRCLCTKVDNLVLVVKWLIGLVTLMFTGAVGCLVKMMLGKAIS